MFTVITTFELKSWTPPDSWYFYFIIVSFLFLSGNVSPTEASLTECFSSVYQIFIFSRFVLVLNCYSLRPVFCKYLFPYRQ